jgi:preprotein translocase subunit SecF
MHIIRLKKYFLIIAGLIVTGAIVIAVTLGLKPSIDFTGGSLMEVRYTTVPDKVLVEEAVEALGFTGGTSIRQASNEAGTGYLVSTRALSDEERVSLASALTTLGEGGEVSRFTSVGPVIGEELKDKAVWAIGAVLFLTICYVAFAFAGIGWPVSSWVYGVITIVVLIHDILVPVAAMSLLGYFTGAEADILFVTVLLTILGYSVNDTIVIFDRVRDKLKQFRTEKKKMVQVPGSAPREEVTYTLLKPFGEIVGQAVDETMARSINTSLTVLFALIALYFFGSTVTENFILILMVGVIAGAYSSIFIANPLLVAYAERQAAREKGN